jgi:DNA-directed RNA polymerase specialized sigma24 family protein
MLKENNCCCVVCHVERSLLNSLNTQTARTHFQALARTYPILNHFDSPADVIAHLHEHERVELVNHKAWNGILHALVDSIADGTAEEIGQQLLLLAYMPAIHRAYVEVCQQFPALAAEDVAQQAALVLLEAARSPAMRNQNGYLPIALARDFHKRLIRWAFGEIRQSAQVQEAPIDVPGSPNASFEHAATLEAFLQQAQRDGLLSDSECELLLKLKYEGFQAKEMAEALGTDPLKSHRRLHRKLQTILNRLRRAARARGVLSGTTVRPIPPVKAKKDKKIFNGAVNFSESVPISKSEKANSQELGHRGPQVEPEVPPIAAWLGPSNRAPRR